MNSTWNSMLVTTRNRFPVSLLEKPSAAKAIRSFSFLRTPVLYNLVKGPLGDQIQDYHDKIRHFDPLIEQISKLEEALHNIQFEQHWLEAQTELQSIVNEAMSKKALHKALYESAALIGASVLQVYLLRRLFEKKLWMSRV
ncbi:transmembrane emp24 domain-containing protein p24beta2-like isoform X2 [Hibiscus syriacus]|uniref:transmembrane emp24 domain-containing protein p24beta2-like isoform X2 n=1 Tax=Hibiscus syriacus TaxID=106335 RepID=UPI0019242F2A|nr:transmembrane emp24 domain-containing protein p24beta2-like isoform X2 [Hibiscus syriacus]